MKKKVLRSEMITEADASRRLHNDAKQFKMDNFRSVFDVSLDDNNVANFHFDCGSSGFIEIGYELFVQKRKGYVCSHYLHVKPSRLLTDLQKQIDTCTAIVAKYPKIECYVNGDTTRDIQNGVVFDLVDHSVKKTFRPIGLIQFLQDEHDYMTGENCGSYKYKRLQKNEDFDLFFNNL